MSEIKAGAEVDAYCTRCKMLLAHAVIAVWANRIKRVRCNTCMGEHAYRPVDPASPASAKPRRSAASASKAGSSSKRTSQKDAASSHDTLMAGKDRSLARPYSPRERFSVGDLIDHPTFGIGLTLATRGLDKLDGSFESGVKTLVHNRGGARISSNGLAAARVRKDEQEDPADEAS